MLTREQIAQRIAKELKNGDYVNLGIGIPTLVANYIPDQKIDAGEESGDLLILGWGGTYGALKTATQILINEGHKVSHAHVRYLSPFPKNLGELMSKFKTVVVPELNNGQLVKIIRDKYFVDAKGYNKIMGVPITKQELVTAVEQYL